MFVQVMEYFQPVFFSWSVRFLRWRRDGFTRRAIERSPSGQFPALVSRPVISAASLSSSAAPSCPVPGFHAPPGTCRIASSSAAVIIHPQVNSTARRGEDGDSRWPMSSWPAPAPSKRMRIFFRNRAGTCRIAAASTSLWSVNVLHPAFPGRSSMPGIRGYWRASRPEDGS